MPPSIVLALATGPLDHEVEYGRRVYGDLSRILGGLAGTLDVTPLLTSHIEARAEAEARRGIAIGAVIVALTGGTDRTIYEFVRGIGRHVLVYTHMRYNALASVREAVAALRMEGYRVGVAIGEIDELGRKIDPFVSALRTRTQLRGARVGVVGKPEPWLLRTVDPVVLRDKFEIDLVEVPWEDMLARASAAQPDEVSRITSMLLESFGRVEVSKEVVEKAVRIYLGLKSVVRERRLDAVAVEARDMLDHRLRDWGPYIAVSLLSAEGVPADYEADVEGVLTKLIIHMLTGRPSFMANITRVDFERKRVIFSHCTVPINMIDPRQSALMTYFETNRSVAIRGKMREGETVTFARIGGLNLDKMLIGSGVITNGDVGRPDLCRTQIEVKVEGDVSKLIEEPLGNHTVVAYGDLREHLIRFCEVSDIEPMTL